MGGGRGAAPSQLSLLSPEGMSADFLKSDPGRPPALPPLTWTRSLGNHGRGEWAHLGGRGQVLLPLRPPAASWSRKGGDGGNQTFSLLSGDLSQRSSPSCLSFPFRRTRVYFFFFRSRRRLASPTHVHPRSCRLLLLLFPGPTPQATPSLSFPACTLGNAASTSLQIYDRRMPGEGFVCGACRTVIVEGVSARGSGADMCGLESRLCRTGLGPGFPPAKRAAAGARGRRAVGWTRAPPARKPQPKAPPQGRRGLAGRGGGGARQDPDVRGSPGTAAPD